MKRIWVDIGHGVTGLICGTVLGLVTDNEVTGTIAAVGIFTALQVGRVERKIDEFLESCEVIDDEPK